MSPVRPVFHDGVILASDDLEALGALDRDRAARHARHLHTPGVAAGLDLVTAERVTGTGARYVDVTLTPGYAIDGTGRELVVATALTVSPDRFSADVPNPLKTVWYPVFVHGLDTTLAAANGQLGCGGAEGAARIAEDVEIEFGALGDATQEQTSPAPDAGAGDGGWRVLVGFVRFDTDIHLFVAAGTEADGVVVPNAGVRAGVVAGPHGRIELRPRPAAAAGLPAVVLDDDQGGSLVFGLHNGAGGVEPLMKVDAAGNLVVNGTLSGQLTSGSVLVASGTAFDGTVLPLPSGADPKSIASGAAKLSVLLTPRPPDPSGAPTSGQRFVPAECRVDEQRRVRCWGTWFEPGSSSVTHEASACDYLVLVSVPKVGA